MYFSSVLFLSLFYFEEHSVLDVFQSLQCCRNHPSGDVTSVIDDLEGLGERRFRTALEIWVPSHAGSLETASANWTLSCQDTSDRAMAWWGWDGLQKQMSLLPGSGRFVPLGCERQPAVLWPEVGRLCRASFSIGRASAEVRAVWGPLRPELGCVRVCVLTSEDVCLQEHS